MIKKTQQGSNKVSQKDSIKQGYQRLGIQESSPQIHPTNASSKIIAQNVAQSNITLRLGFKEERPKMVMMGQGLRQ